MVLVAWIRKCFQFNSGFNSKNDRIVLEEVNREGKDFGVTLAWFPVINLNKFVTTGARGLVVFACIIAPQSPFFICQFLVSYMLHAQYIQNLPFLYKYIQKREENFFVFKSRANLHTQSRVFSYKLKNY